MKTRQEALDFGLSFPDTYASTPFRDTNWQLVRVRGSKKAFLWIYVFLDVLLVKIILISWNLINS